MSDEKSQHIETRAVHAGVEPDATTGAIMTPIFQTSTYVQEAPGKHKGWDYSRGGNPTRDALESAFAALENAKFGLSFSSGLAAEQAIIQTLDVPSKVVVCDDVYGGTGRLFRKLFAKYGIEFEFVDLTDLSLAEKHIDDKTKLVWVETPTNPTMKIMDIEKLAAMTHKVGGRLVVDNTFATPVFQSPLEQGADLVLHSTTKYIGGHSDIIGGAVMLNDQAWRDELHFIQFAAGAVPSPLECFLLLRSVKTLPVRMKQHQENVFAVAKFLEGHDKVAKVFFPGSESHPHFQVAQKQMRGHSGMISFNYNGTFAEVTKFTQSLKVFALAESLGGVESLINHPEEMTHASVPEELRRQLGIGPTLLRLSCGIENPDDLVNDLEQAFAAASQ